MALVKLILREEVPNLGHAGDVVDVKPGYARNYLVPEGLAIHASPGKLAELEHYKRGIEERVARERKDKEALRERIESLVLRVQARAGEEGRLFGSVTSAHLASLLTESGVEVDRRRIELPEPIKELGEHAVPVRLHRDVSATVRVVVEPEGGAPAPAEALPDEDAEEGGSPEESEDAEE